MRIIALFTFAVALAGANANLENLIIRDTLPPACDQALYPVIARDVDAGAAFFEYCSGPAMLKGYTYPRIAAGPARIVHVAMLDSLGQGLYYARLRWRNTWDAPVEIAPPQIWPGFPSHNIAATGDSGLICITWVCDVDYPQPGFFRVSSDTGTTWAEPQQLPWPEAYGGDTVTSFHTSSLFPFYDNSNRLHIVASVHPVVNDTGLVMPAEIWHWCPDNTPNWSMIQRAGCAPEHLLAPVGYDALYAGRPSLKSGPGGYLYTAWEQFDSSDVDTGPPPRLRADIHMGSSGDNGKTWYVLPGKLTSSASCSRRFPCVGGRWGDTVCVSYLMDQRAGFYVRGEGLATNNPVICGKLNIWSMSPRLQEDTVGGTTYDLQSVGPALNMADVSPDYGVHVLWLRSQSTSGPFLDLNMGYNFYDFNYAGWWWIDPDFMMSGVGVFTERIGTGTLAADPETGVALVSGRTTSPGSVSDRKSTPGPQSDPRNPTIVRGWLMLAPASSLDPQAASLLDISGRKAMELRPGENDVSHLAPGVYFVHSPFGTRHSSLATKVVVSR